MIPRTKTYISAKIFREKDLELEVYIVHNLQLYKSFLCIEMEGP